MVEELRGLAPDLIVVVAFGQILPKSVLDIPRYGCINVHASLLPRYRGAAPINQAIIDGETETGVTTMYMDVGLDTGDMLVKRTTPIGPDETAGELHDRLALLGREAMAETLRAALRRHPDPRTAGRCLSSYAPMLKKEQGRIDWTRPAVDLHNQVRGLDPWPGAYTLLAGEPLKLARTQPGRRSPRQRTGNRPGRRCRRRAHRLRQRRPEGRRIAAPRAQAPAGRRLPARLPAPRRHPPRPLT